MMGLFRWFWYVAIGNPIAVRTICGGSRRMRHQWVRMGYLGVLIGLGWSLKSRRVLGAVIPSVALVAALVAVLGFCGWGAVSSVGVFGTVVNAFSPVTSVVVLVDPWRTVAQFDEALGMGRGLLAFSAVLAGGVYVGVVYAAINSMVRGFDQTVRRISGQS